MERKFEVVIEQETPWSTKRFYKCSECDKKFDTYGRVLKHKKWMHEGGYDTCPLCKEPLESKKSLIEHIYSHGVYEPDPHNIFSEGPSGKGFSCPICRKNISMNSDCVFSHLYGHGESILDIPFSEEYSCQKCNFSCSSRINFQRHLHYIHKGKRCATVVTCDFCKRTFRHKGNLTEHMKVHTQERKQLPEERLNLSVSLATS